MKSIKSTRFASAISGHIRRARLTDLPDSAEQGAPSPAPKKGSGKPAAKKVTGSAKAAEEKQGKKEAAAKTPGKKAPAASKETPAKKGATSKEKPAAKSPAKEKPAAEGRKPRVEGRIDLVYRSGPERTLAIKVAEKHGHKLEKLEKVDNCTLGVTVAGAKAAALREEYISRRDAWRKAQDELIEKHIAKLA